jgi:hypothetical protein
VDVDFLTCGIRANLSRYDTCGIRANLYCSIQVVSEKG